MMNPPYDIVAFVTKRHCLISHSSRYAQTITQSLIGRSNIMACSGHSKSFRWSCGNPSFEGVQRDSSEVPPYPLRVEWTHRKSPVAVSIHTIIKSLRYNPAKTGNQSPDALLTSSCLKKRSLTPIKANQHFASDIIIDACTSYVKCEPCIQKVVPSGPRPQ